MDTLKETWDAHPAWKLTEDCAQIAGIFCVVDRDEPSRNRCHISFFPAHRLCISAQNVLTDMTATLESTLRLGLDVATLAKSLSVLKILVMYFENIATEALVVEIRT